MLFGPFPNNRIDFFIASTRTWLSRVEEEIDSFLLAGRFGCRSHELTIEFKFRVSTYNIRALTYNIKEFL